MWTESALSFLLTEILPGGAGGRQPPVSDASHTPGGQI